jgi:IPT/TIG domain
VRGSALNHRGASLMRNALSISVVVALGLVAAGSAAAVTITGWVGGKATVPQVVTAAGTCPGTVITINGSGFVSDGGITNVMIGGVPAGEITIGSDSTLFARVGAGAQNGSVSVSTKLGTATSPTPAIVYPCQSTAVATEKPAILSVSPQRAKSGKKLTLTGSGFVGTTSVKVGTGTVSYAIPSDNRMYVNVPADVKAGLTTILVTTNKGTAKVVFQKTG